MINAVIDLSHHNTVTSFPKIKAAGVVGIIHKATQGTGFKDSEYAARKKKATDAGLLWGAYHFGTGASTGAAQADFFLSVVNPGPSDLLVLDFEENTQGASMTLQQARDFVTRVEEKTGRFPGLYAGSFLKAKLGNASDPVLAKCWFWIAQYASQPKIPANWADWTMWQYTDGTVGPEPHRVDGVAGPVDRDQFNGDLGALLKLWNVVSPVGEIPQPEPAGP